MSKKNMAVLAALVIAALYGWLYVNLQVWPDAMARDWVETVRLNLDGDMAHRFRWNRPIDIPETAWTRPEGGISDDFTLEAVSYPSWLDPVDSRVITFKVEFGPSPVAQTRGRAERRTYNLVMRDFGSYLKTDWRMIEFEPERRRFGRR